ncbi:hypothetical protein WR25_01819 [Diploscapter pachys]|uniref:Uncharacterized protein n=1 Tax=Diploscapter pachys TaxID=2018661 RepID=A0A2A2K7B3_9BILA|nr:hypothetical protein WR25_01819 [Diploscapter pachys]
MEVKKPLADEIADILQAQFLGAEHGDPLGIAALDQVLDRLGVQQVRGLQAHQANIAGLLQRRLERATSDIPADTAQAWQQAVAIVSGVDDQQAAMGCRFKHDLSLAPVIGFLPINRQLRRPN